MILWKWKLRYFRTECSVSKWHTNATQHKYHYCKLYTVLQTSYFSNSEFLENWWKLKPDVVYARATVSIHWLDDWSIIFSWIHLFPDSLDTSWTRIHWSIDWLIMFSSIYLSPVRMDTSRTNTGESEQNWINRWNVRLHFKPIRQFTFFARFT